MKRENLIYEIQFLRKLLFKRDKVKKEIESYKKSSKKVSIFSFITSIIVYISAFIAYINVKYNSFIVEAQGNYIMKSCYQDNWFKEYFIINFIIMWTILLILPIIILKLNKDRIEKLIKKEINIDNKLEYYIQSNGSIPEKYLKPKVLKQFNIYLNKGKAGNVQECVGIYNSQYSYK